MQGFAHAAESIWIADGANARMRRLMMRQAMVRQTSLAHVEGGGMHLLIRFQLTIVY